MHKALIVAWLVSVAVLVVGCLIIQATTKSAELPVVTETAMLTVAPSEDAIPAPTPPPYTAEELDLLSRIIYAEAGGMDDQCQLLAGNVVLNRMTDERFPDTLHDVIYQKGQYAPTWNGAIHKTPSERAVANAKRLLEGERFCPANVVWQAEFKQGRGVYRKFESKGGVMYFCY
jgi:hypothetical protein